jgi:tetratricopeptide (TPR) repeat protein
LEEYHEAESILRDGVAAYPEHSVLRNNLGALLELLGRVDEAIELLQAALADEPSLPQLSKNLGDLHYRSARYDDAWDAYQRAVKLQPELGDDVYFKLGNIAYKRLDRELASELWKRALEINPNHELALTNLETVSALK